MPVTPDPAASAAPAPETAPPSPPDAPAGDASGPPSLIWPPAEDELRDWEVLHLHSTGQTVIEPMKYVPPSGTKMDAPRSGERPVPSAPAPYVPPAPIDDPVGEASLRPVSSDFNLPETELIEPLTVAQEPPQATVPITSPHALAAGARPAAVSAPASETLPDERTVVIPRTPFGTPRHEPRHEASEDTNPGSGATRILVAPKFAATVGHMPTVPVSALHRSAIIEPKKPESPRNPLEETLPAGVTREQLFAPQATPGADTSDDTATVRPSQADTHPVPIAVPKAAPASAGPPSPFSRVASRTPQPVAAAAPAPTAPSRPAPAPVPLAASAPVLGPNYGAPVPARRAAGSPLARVLVLGLVAALAVAVALGAYWYLSERTPAAAALVPATLSIDSTPAGAAVSIDGTPRGRTPLRLELSEGAHTLDVTHEGTTKHIPLTLAAGTVTAHSLEFALPAAVTADAAIEIRSDPAGGRVVVDGVARGATPIVVTGLTSGRHEVQVSGPFRAVTRTVTLAPKQQALLVVTPARSAANDAERPSRTPSDTGFIAIQSPIVLRIVRNGDFVGTSEDARLSLPAGEHVIGLENESVGYRDVRTVQVVAGKVTSVPVTLPNGSISINARPWAEVFVDGHKVGDTPVSQYALPVGIHEILFRHPELGERTVTVVVKLGATGRAFTDFTK